VNFEKFLTPMAPAHFWSAVWETAPLHLSGRAADQYRAIFTRGEAEALAFDAALPTDAVQLCRGAERVTGDRRERYGQGYTIVVAAAERFAPRLAATLAEIERSLRARCTAHLIVSPAHAQGLAPHSDGHGVFALQIAGAKRWLLYEGTQRADALHGIDRHELCGTAPTREVALDAGDLLYLPRGLVHAAATGSAPSIHLALAILPPTGADLLALLARHAEKRAFFRGYIPYGIGDTPQRRAAYAAAFRAQVTALLDAVDPYALLDARSAERAAQRE
jgi:ribosomal protein L16 Arg81 hydroxylase